MSKKILSAILAGVMSISLMAGCGEKEATGEVENEAAKINVTVNEASVMDIETKATYTGNIITNDFAYVTSKVSAKVSDIKVDLGDYVKKGDVMVVLDSSDYQYQLSMAQATYAQAEAAYNSALTGLDNVGGVNEQTKLQLEQAVSMSKLAYEDAQKNYDRQKQLYDMGAISLAAFEGVATGLENARLAYESALQNYNIAVNVLTPGNEESAKNGVETAKAAMNAASISISQAQQNIANTVIKAPIDGYVSTKSIASGQFAAAGNPMFMVSDSDELEVEIKVTEALIPYVKVGGKAEISVSSASLYDIEGTVTLVNSIKDQATGMYIVRVKVDEENENLKIGMNADVTLITSQSIEGATAVLSQSIMQQGDEYYVYVIKDSKAEKRVVKCGVTDGVYTQIIEGVEEGEAVCAEGKEFISEANNLVNIVE